MIDIIIKSFKYLFTELSFKKIAFLVSASAVVIYMALPLFASDFDKFAKKTIRSIGHNGDQQLVSKAVNTYLKDNHIDDPIAFFTKNMDRTYVIDADDPNLSERDRSSVRDGDVKRLTSFRSTYFKYWLLSHRLVIRVWDLRSGERRIHAHIYYDAP